MVILYLLQPRNMTDVGRLRGIYDKYSGTFLNAIAAEFSND